MSERLVISVAASPDGSGELRIEDAFQQILDCFELAKWGADEVDDSISWHLVAASMKSPFMVAAEARSNRPGVNPDSVAKSQKQRLAHNMAEIQEGRVPPAWRQGRAHDLARRVVERGTRAVAETKIRLDSGGGTEGLSQEVVITSANAVLSLVTFDSFAPPKPDLVRPKTQIGSVEGYFASVATHYGHPAIVMRERKTGRDIKCLISEDDSKRIADEIRIDDVWHNARIVAHGRISYADNGAVSRVEAHTIRRVNSAGVELQLDREFTSGMSSFDYLEAFREGALG